DLVGPGAGFRARAVARPLQRRRVDPMITSGRWLLVGATLRVTANVTVASGVARGAPQQHVFSCGYARRNPCLWALATSMRALDRPTTPTPLIDVHSWAAFLAVALIGLAGCGDGTAPKPPTCGDGIVTAGEECDDGNQVEHDGCSPLCR